MRVLSVYPDSAIETRFVDLLLTSLGVRDAELWLVSPWMGDLEVSLEDRGLFLPLLGEGRRVVQLSELLGVLGRDNDLHLVVRPPHVLLARGELPRLLQLLETRRELAATTGNEAVRSALALLESETEAIAANLMTHAGTIHFVRAVTRIERARVHYNPKLHAKVLWTPTGSIIGSANFTWSGMHGNDELSLLVTDHQALQDLRQSARATASRYFSVAEQDYNFRNSLTPVDRETIPAILRHPLTPSGLASFLNLCLAAPT